MPGLSEGFLSPWLQRQGFIRDPFAFKHAERQGQEMLQETYVYDEGLEQLMLDADKSVAFLAPFGGGKTAARQYLQFRWQRKKRQSALIVVYNDFESVSRALSNINLDTHISSLIGAIAESVWSFLEKESSRSFRLDVGNQNKWLAPLFHYLPEDYTPSESAPGVLNEAYNSRAIETSPAMSGGLIWRLRMLCSHLSELGLNQLLVLVDEVDSLEENSREVMESMVRPLLNTKKLFSLPITWKFFLPDVLESVVQTSSAYRRLSLEAVRIEWNEESLWRLLQERLMWASQPAGRDGGIHSLSNLSEVKLATLDEERTIQSDLDREFIQLVLQNQMQFGAPRTLLKFGDDLIDCLEKRGDDVITEAGWQEFRRRVASSTPPRAEISGDNVADTHELDEQIIKSITPIGLAEIVEQGFNLRELEELCFDLSIKYDDIPGTTLGGKARALVDYFDRRGRLRELVTVVHKLRPKLFEEYKLKE